MFDCHIDRRRFWFILPVISKSGMMGRIFPEKIRKTGCFYSEKLNVYIDTSDGIASDFGVPEYCDRILRIAEDSKGKPFLFFKPWYSKTLCEPLEKVAKENNGKIIPFMYWADWDHFIRGVWPNRKDLFLKNKNTDKIFDVGACVNLVKREIPKPSRQDSRISWKGYGWFGFGAEEDTGYYTHDTRIILDRKLKNSKFKYQHISGISFEKYLDQSMSWKCLIDMPGIACVSHRMFENGWIGQTVVLSKNDVDFPYSWKEYYPEIDFNSNNWEERLGSIIENYDEWSDKITHYLETYCTPTMIGNYFLKKVVEELDSL
jgi:hypothetical protein